MAIRNNHNDEKWNLLKSGNEQCFYDCFDACYDDLYHLGLFLYKDAELVKESIQLLFIELWKIKDKFEDIRNVKEYVITIYKRILFKQKRIAVKYWTKTEDINDSNNIDEDYSSSYEEMMINAQENSIRRNNLLAVFTQLSERQKELIRMRFFEEKTIEEIASATALTPRTVYNTLHNALTKLKELLAQ